MRIVAGVDEVGRGALAGPVLAAAVILDHKHSISGLTDSKRLTAKQREFYYDWIVQHSLAYAVGRADADEIDAINIVQATCLAMRRAIASLSITPDIVLVDGSHGPSIPIPVKPIVRGDQTELCISAASIVAKVTRDDELQAYEAQKPACQQYGFARHKGYGTKAHYAVLKRLGPSQIHRRSFRLI